MICGVVYLPVSVFKMKKHYPKELFKSVIYEIETYTNRMWTVKEIVENQYPNTFQYAVVESRMPPKNQRIVVSNSYAPIFAIVDADSVQTTQFFKDGFVREPAIEQSLETSLMYRNQEHNILTPEILDLSFSSETELEDKLNQIGVKRSEIELTLEVIDSSLFDYKLFHGENIGFELFNFWDD
jgi:hypothetical protein